MFTSAKDAEEHGSVTSRPILLFLVASMMTIFVRKAASTGYFVSRKALEALEALNQKASHSSIP